MLHGLGERESLGRGIRRVRGGQGRDACAWHECRLAHTQREWFVPSWWTEEWNGGWRRTHQPSFQREKRKASKGQNERAKPAHDVSLRLSLLASSAVWLASLSGPCLVAFGGLFSALLQRRYETRREERRRTQHNRTASTKRQAGCLFQSKKNVWPDPIVWWMSSSRPPKKCMYLYTTGTRIVTLSTSRYLLFYDQQTAAQNNPALPNKGNLTWTAGADFSFILTTWHVPLRSQAHVSSAMLLGHNNSQPLTFMLVKTQLPNQLNHVYHVCSYIQLSSYSYNLKYLFKSSDYIASIRIGLWWSTERWNLQNNAMDQSDSLNKHFLLRLFFSMTFFKINE
jgi:hypothetical protein